MRSPQRSQSTGGRGPALMVSLAVLVVTAAACGSGSKATTAPVATSSPSTSTAAPATSAVPPGSGAAVAAASSDKGTVLVDSRGFTLYTFDPENSGTIACTGGCATLWLPLIAPGGGSPSAGSGVTVALATVARPDGAMQVTAGGHRLYTYSLDKAKGDTRGDGVGGKWHVARPTGGPSGTQPATTSTTSSYRY